MIKVDIVVPVRNEALTIPPLLESLGALELPDDVRLGVLFIEDGSRDDTVPLLRELSRDNPYAAALDVDFFSMRNGFGEGPAMIYGIHRSEADAVIMMGADGSCPVDEVPRLIEAFRGGAEVVQCLRRSLEGRTGYRDMGTDAFVWLVWIITGSDFREQNIYYRLMSRDFCREVLKHRRYWRYARFPLPDKKSGKLVTIEVDMVERVAGASSYTFSRLLLQALDGILCFLSPGRLMGWVGLSAVVAWLLSASGWASLAVLAMVPSFVLAFRFVQLDRTDYLAKLVLAESSRDA